MCGTIIQNLATNTSLRNLCLNRLQKCGLFILMANPKILYHASQINHLDILEPANITPRFARESNCIFATPYKAVAAMFLAPRELSTEISKYGENFVIFVKSSLAEYKKLDRGGSIYTVDGSQFNTDASIGMGETEWICDHSIAPLSEETYKSSLMAMRSLGVKIYFVDNATFVNIQSNPSNGLSLVNESSKFTH